MVVQLKHYKSEKELITACCKNDRKAQRQLFEEQAPIMLTLCRRYMKTPDLAEEMMISGFAKTFEKLDQFKFEGSFQGWVRRIMVNTCLTWIRKNKEMYVEVEIYDAKKMPKAESMESFLEAEDLMALIEKLPQGYRTIFNLYAIEGYTHEEIAEKLDISTGTSKSQLSRARKYLQGQMARIEESEKNKKREHGG